MGDDTRMVEPCIDDRHAWPGEARLRDFGVSVWAIVASYLVLDENVGAVAQDYHVPPEAVEAALAYYRLHQSEIDARIAQHDAAFA